MTFTLTSTTLRIKNTWISDGLSEILSTFILAIIVIGCAAQDVITRGSAASIAGRNLASGMGLCLAVYMGGNASGACVNPTIALAFCVLGKVKWRKYPLFVLCEIIGAFCAAGCVYGLWADTLDKFDGGKRQLTGVNATASVFATFPRDGVPNLVAFYEVVASNALLVGLSIAMVDSRNTNPHLGVVPVPLGFLVFAIVSGFSYHSGAPINPGIDFGGRCLAAVVGYGSEMFTRNSYYFWIPIVGDFVGATLAILIYQFFIGLHLKPLTSEVSQKESAEFSEFLRLRDTSGINHDNKGYVTDDGFSSNGMKPKL